MSERLCVLTGDIVDSRALDAGQLDAAMAALADTVQAMADWSSARMPLFERFRGDGWQLLLPAPRWALRACLVLRAAARTAAEPADTRIGVGIDTGRLDASLATSQGKAFEISGEQLEHLGGRQRWAINGAFGSSASRSLAQGLFGVCDAVSQGWTQRQAEAFGLRAQPASPTMADIATQLDVTQQTVQAHLAKAFADTLLAACEAFEHARDNP